MPLEAPELGTAGRELDIQIAHLLGWKEDTEMPGWVLKTEGGERRCIPGPPGFSADIAAAWMVVEELGLLVTPTLVSGWGAGVFKGCTGHPDGGQRYVEPGTWAEAWTAPEAICRAALKVAALAALGQEEEIDAV